MSLSCDAVVPRWLLILLKTALPGAVALALRLVYEQTFMTWHQGEQMVGFSLMHIFPFLFLWLLLAPLALVSVVIWGVIVQARGFQVKKQTWLAATALCIFTGLLFVPYSFWMVATVRIAGPDRMERAFL